MTKQNESLLREFIRIVFLGNWKAVCVLMAIILVCEVIVWLTK